MAKQVNFLGLNPRYPSGNFWSISRYAQDMVGHTCKIPKIISV